MQMIQIALEAKGVSAQSLSHYLGGDVPMAESLSLASSRTTSQEMSDPIEGGIDL
jgi:hypothetical protein